MKIFKNILDDILMRFSVIIPTDLSIVPLHEPEFDHTDSKMVLDCLNSGWVSSVGKYVNLFEEVTAKFCGVKHGTAVVNGTAGLELALKACSVIPGQEVLVPSLTFVATANAIHNIGAVPHFIDVDEKNLGVDASKLEKHLDHIVDFKEGGVINRQTGRKITCLIVMHTFGHPVDMDAVMRVAKKFGLPVVEDAAEALGSEFKEKECGSLGTLSVISFNGNKIVTTGGGGMVLTDDESLANKVRHLATTAKINHRWKFNHDMPAHNYRLPNLNAALGLGQMTKINARLKAKRRLAHKYIKEFNNADYGKIFQEGNENKSNYWLNTMILNDEHSLELRDYLLDGLNDSGFQVRPCWELMHTLPFHKNCPVADLKTSEKLARTIINLPSSAHLGGKITGE